MSSDDVLRHDPAFAEALHQRAAVSAEIRQLEDGLRADQNAVLQEIQQRRAALRVKERTAQQQILGLERRLDPTRQLIQAKLRETEEMLRRTVATVQSVRRTRVAIDRLIQQQSAARRPSAPASAEASAGTAPVVPTADLQSWTAQRTMMDQQLPALDAQAAALRRQRALYLAELRLLRR